MIFNAKDIKIGAIDVQKLVIGKKTLWERGKYLDIAPSNIWLQMSNGNQANVKVFSNVEWKTN